MECLLDHNHQPFSTQSQQHASGIGRTDTAVAAIQREGPIRLLPTLKAATTATARLTRAVGGDRSGVLDAADFDAATGESAEGGDAARARGARARATLASDADVDGVDADFLHAGQDVDASHHSGVGRRLVTVGLDLHATGEAADGLAAGEVRDVLRKRDTVSRGQPGVLYSTQAIRFLRG